MGMLHKLVYVLARLDLDNSQWRALQRQKAVAETEEAYMIGDRAERKARLDDIEEAFANNTSDYGRKLYLIENCIYGVDIQPIAVQIAKLRFFISLVVDQTVDDSRPNRGIRPLPNLETKFVAANTLIGIARPQQHGAARPGHRADRARALAEVRKRHFAARTPATKEKYRGEDQRLRSELAALLRRDGWDDRTAAQLAAWDPYDQNAHADFFDPEWMFGLAEGFDVMIGNPPYVRQEQLAAFKPIFQQQYSCYTGTADLYVYFFERGLRLLREGGVLTYISSNKYFRAGYGAKLRGYLAGQTRIEQLIDFGDAPVFTAIAYPSIIVLTKAAPGDGRLRALNWEPGPPLAEFAEVLERRQFAMPQAALGADGWRLEGADALALLDKLRRAGPPLGEYVGGRLLSRHPDRAERGLRRRPGDARPADRRRLASARCRSRGQDIANSIRPISLRLNRGQQITSLG
jgi:adenine-specific DNA-methyltransferase